MSRRKCCLCESPIVNGRCSVCGMPYRNDEEMYHLNEPRREHYKHASPEVQKRLKEMEQPKKAANSSQKYNGNAAKHQNSTAKYQSNTSRQNKGAKSGAGQMKSRMTSVRYNGQPVHGSRKMADDYRKKTSAGKGRKWLWIVIGIALICEIVPGVIGMIIYKINDYEDRHRTPEPIEITQEFSREEEGLLDGAYELKPYEGILTSGEYVVGKDIPAGVYKVDLEENTDGAEMELSLTDNINGIYEFLVFTHENPGKYEYLVEEKQDLILKDEGSFQLTGKGKLHFVCEEAYYNQNWEKIENPMSETVYLKEEMKAGEDFLPGVYDIFLEEGESAGIEIEKADGDMFSFSASRDGFYGVTEFLHVTLEEGAVIRMTDYGAEYGESCKVAMKSSEWIYQRKGDLL